MKEGSLNFTQPGLSMPAAAGVVDEKGSEYILAHTGPRELDGHPLGGRGSGFWFSSRLYYPFGKGPGQHIIRCLKNKKCENERMCETEHLNRCPQLEQKPIECRDGSRRRKPATRRKRIRVVNSAL